MSNYTKDNLILYLDAGKWESYPTTGKVWYDLSGNNNHATGAINGAGSGVNDNNFPEWHSIDGGCFYFKGGTTGFNIENDMGTSTEGTVEFLVKKKNNGASMYFADARNGGGGWYLTNYLSRNLHINTELEANDPVSYSTTSSFFGRWVHIVIVSDSVNGSALWIDGERITDSRIIKTDPVNMTFGSNFRIGIRYTNSGPLVGYMKVVRLYNRRLTEAEIKNNYEDCSFKTPLGHIISNDNDKVFDVVNPETNIVMTNKELTKGSYNNYSLYFNGNTGRFARVTLGDISHISVPLTFYSRIKKITHNPATYPIFWSFGLPYLAINGSTSPIRYSYTDVGGAQRNIEGTTIPALNTWYDVAVVVHKDYLKLYVNGVLEKTETTFKPRITHCTGGILDIGRHINDEQYRIWGNIEDWRVYNRILSDDEISLLSKKFHYPIMKVNKKGSMQVKSFEEDYEWTLMDNFTSVLDGENTPYTEALGGLNINSSAKMTASGWSQYLTTIESATYTRIKGYCQMFYSSTPFGTITKTLPDGYDMVKVKWGNWYSGISRIYIGGQLRRELSASYGADVYVGPYTPGDTIQFWENGIFWAGEVWVGKKKKETILNKSKVNADTQISYKPTNLINYNTWQLGSTGTQGSFQAIGTNEDFIVLSEDPWGNPTNVWECRPDAVSGPDGGWNHNISVIDNTKMYHYACWIKRNNTESGDLYHGCNGYGTINGVLKRSNGVNDTNPYFNYGKGLPVNRWHLLIGTTWPVGSGTGAAFPLSGIYTTNGVKVLNVLDDFVWRAQTTSGRVRTYLYYTTNTNQRQWMVYPMFWQVDPNKPPITISELLSGKTQSNFGRMNFENIAIKYNKKLTLKDKTFLLDDKVTII